MARESTTHGKPVLAAGAMMALGVLSSGCGYSSGPMMYARETHAQRVEAWCYHNLTGRKTESLIRQCVDQVWINVPLGECDIDPCADTGRFYPPYDARRGYNYK